MTKVIYMILILSIFGQSQTRTYIKMSKEIYVSKEEHKILVNAFLKDSTLYDPQIFLNIQNILSPKKTKFRDGIYHYDMMLHEPKIFVKDKHQIKIFNSETVSEFLNEYIKIKNELFLSDKKSIKYLKGLYLFLKRNYYDGSLHVNKLREIR